MTWKEASEELHELADQLDRVAHLCRKNLFSKSVKRAEMAEFLAAQCRRTAEKKMTLPQGLQGPHDEVMLRIYRVLKSRVDLFLDQKKGSRSSA